MAMMDWSKIDEAHVLQVLEEAGEKLDGGNGEVVVVDFSAVRRINSSVLHRIEEFANRADKKAVKVALRGVNVDVYKVLKLVQLAPRFSFTV